MIYLDNNATTPVAEEVFSAMEPFLTAHYGNPSSAHSLAGPVRTALEEARTNVAAFLGAKDQNEIVFTSGGTESDNWAILGTLEARPEKRRIVTTKVEHEAVRRVFEKLEETGFEVVWLEVDGKGRLNPEHVAAALNDETALVSVMMANNETGVVFPVDEIGELVRNHSGAAFHVDGVNAAGKIPIDLKKTEIDLFSVSAHKFHGPKGVGALYIRSGYKIATNSIGGGQEFGQRAGTEAVHQIAGLGAASALASNLDAMELVRSLRDRLETGILDRIEGSSVTGDTKNRLPNTSNICFEGLNGELILSKLDRLGICVSTGSACNEAEHVASPVLKAMNVPYRQAMGAIRFSLGRYNTPEEIGFVLEKLPAVVDEARLLAN